MDKTQNNEAASKETEGCPSQRVLFCNCTYAKVVPQEVKSEVLAELSDSGIAFDAVADLCDMSARKDPALIRIAQAGDLKIAACFPRTVRWLFHAAKTPLQEKGVEILNMREEDAKSITSRLLSPTGNGKETA